MTKYYVNISGVPNGTLAFFGISLAYESDEFALYVDQYGNDHIVDKGSPHLYVEDINDAIYLGSSVIAIDPEIENSN